jgi:preprotein translocase subunit SecA
VSALAWAHLPGSLYPERHAAPVTGLDEWARIHLGRRLPARHSRLGAHLRTAQRAVALEPQVRLLDTATLAARLRSAARQCVLNDGPAEWALALVREAAHRSLGLQPYPAQLAGAMCLIAGQMAEMQTGEGKTLTAGLAAAVVACAGVPVHVITVNDYLAQRDADELRPLMALLGLRTGTIVTGMEAGERRASYACDVAYCTGKELVFDYLKDRSAHGAGANQARLRLGAMLGGREPPTLLRGLHFGIVDEADSVLIDEARTPLILSENAGPTAATGLLAQALDLAARMAPGEHYELHEGRRELHLLPAGRLWLTESCVLLGGEWTVRHAREHWALQALRAIHLFRRDEHYIVKEGKVQIVDENTGRALPGRTWEHGLHQIVETREGCPLSDQARTVARITYQRFFRRYLRLSGMTGTAQEVRQELWTDYHLRTLVVPTHRPCVRQVQPTQCLATESLKWQCIAERARELSAAGRPVLIGTRSVSASERLSAVLREHGLVHRVLNAMQDAGEAELVAEAGVAGRITVATNMAGRGTDIKLSPEVCERGGLHVILSEFHESPRIDRQLFGRAARQGDPGSAQAIVSFDDPLFAGHAALWLPWLRAWGGRGSASAASAAALLRASAQRSSEHLHARTRRQAVKEDQRLETSLSFSGRH